MYKEKVYAWIEESDKREIMELLDAVVGRFRELYNDRELVVLSLPKGEARQLALDRITEMLRKEP